MKTAILASLIATAAAFAPAQQGKTSTVLKVSELGTFIFLGGPSYVLGICCASCISVDP